MTESDKHNAAEAAPAKKKRPVLRALLVLVVILALYVGWNVFDSAVLLEKATITVSPETTYITGPLNADGTVNYTQALIDRYSEGVTPDNNAMTLLVQAFDADDFLPEDARPDILRQLGLSEQDLAAGEKFVRWRHYLKAAGLDIDDIDPDYDLFARLGRRPWVAEDQPEVAAWLADNAEPLATISRAVRRPHNYFPIVGTDDPPCVISIRLPGLALYREAAWAMMARAMLHLASGETAEARADADTIHRLARAPRPFLIAHLVNVSLVGHATSVDRAIIASGKLSPEEMREMLANLRARPPMPDFADVLETELMFFLDSTMFLYRSGGISEVDTPVGTLKDRSFVDWDMFLRQGIAHYTRMIQAAKLPYPERRVQEDVLLEELMRNMTEGRTYLLIRAGFHAITQNKRATRKLYADVLSRVLLSMLMPEFCKIHTIQEITQTRGDLTLLALAAKLHKADNGDWPGQLADLAPEYVDDVPRDRFTDQPLMYVQIDDSVRIYSLGPNMTDDDGLNADELADDDDTTDYPKDADDLVIELR